MAKIALKNKLNTLTVGIRQGDLLHLARQRQRCHTYQLQLRSCHRDPSQCAVQQANREPQGRSLEFHHEVHVDQPVHQDGAHLPSEVGLAHHVIPVRRMPELF